MPSFLPEMLKIATGGEWVNGTPPMVSGFHIDSRQTSEGQMFVAIASERRDGHDFVGHAFTNGAVAALVEREVEGLAVPQLVVEDTVAALHAIARAHRRQFPGPVIGITGSCGKTSTKEILARLLGDYGVHRTPGNWNNLLGVPLTLLGLDPVEHRYAVIEAGMNQPGELEKLARLIEPDISIVTNVSPAHIGNLESLEAIAREKSQLVRYTKPWGMSLFPAACLNYGDFLEGETTRVVLVDDDAGRDGFPGVFCLESELTLRGNGIRQCLLRLRGAAETLELVLPRMSRGMAQNAILAYFCAMRLGMSRNLLQLRLLHWEPPSSRGEILRVRDAVFYVDCYNASPASMVDSVDAFREQFAGEKRLFLLGGMNELGALSARLHHEVGEKIGYREGEQFLLLGEDADHLAEGLRAGGVPREGISVLGEREEARVAVEGWRGAVLFKGSRSYELEKLLPACPGWEERRAVC